MSRLPHALASTLIDQNMVLSGISSAIIFLHRIGIVIDYYSTFSSFSLCKSRAASESTSGRRACRFYTLQHHNLMFAACARFSAASREAHFSVSSAVLSANDSLGYLIFLSCFLHFSQLKCGTAVDSFSLCSPFYAKRINSSANPPSKFLFFHNKSIICLEVIVSLAPLPALRCTVHMVWS